MKNKEYWQKRFDLLQAQQLNKGIEFYHNLSEQYDKAAASVQKEIEAFYQRFAKNNELDLLEAKKLLNSRQLKEFRWSVAEYIEKGKTLNYSNQWAKELENASIRYRVTRLEALKLQMQQQVENLMGSEVDGLDNLTRQIYEDGYYRTIFELQKGTGVTSSFAILDAYKIKKVLSKPWASDGLNFSRRVWGEHRAELVQKLNTDFVQALIRGDDSKKLIDKISSDFNISKYKAGRLVMTESAFFASESQKDAFKELGVKYFSVSATFDKDTCSDCSYREGEKIPMDLYEVGVTAPPFHPNCRCDIVPEDTDGDIKSYRAARDKDGNYVEVSNDMTYMQWKKKFLNESSLTNLNINDKIFARSNNMSLEFQRYGRNKNTLVNKTYINSGEYRNKFDKITDNKDVNRVLYQKAKEMLLHRSGTLFEDMYWIDATSGKIVASELNSKAEQKIIYSNSTKSKLSKLKEETLITLHSHPASFPPSISDFNSIYQYKYKIGLIVCHDGKIFKYTSKQKISEKLFELYVSQYMDSGYDEFDSQINALNELQKSYEISFCEVK